MADYLVQLNLPVGVIAERNTDLARAIQSGEMTDELRAAILENVKDLIDRFGLVELEPKISRIGAEPNQPDEYEVEVVRISYGNSWFPVRAYSISEAEQLALDLAKNEESWTHYYSEYRVDTTRRVEH